MRQLAQQSVVLKLCCLELMPLAVPLSDLCHFKQMRDHRITNNEGRDAATIRC